MAVILESDGLDMDEADIFKYLKEWATVNSVSFLIPRLCITGRERDISLVHDPKERKHLSVGMKVLHPTKSFLAHVVMLLAV